MPIIFDNIVGKPGELRYDEALNITYRYNSREEEWEIDGAGTPSSASFPIENLQLQEIREDIDTGRKYRWNGSDWVLISLATITSEQIVDGAITEDKLANDSVETAKIKDLNVTTGKLADGAVTLAKTGITISDVTVLASETTGTATVPAGSVVLSIVPVLNQDHLVDSVLVSDTTLTVTLGTAATADNVFKVVTIV